MRRHRRFWSHVALSCRPPASASLSGHLLFSRSTSRRQAARRGRYTLGGDEVHAGSQKDARSFCSCSSLHVESHPFGFRLQDVRSRVWVVGFMLVLICDRCTLLTAQQINALCQLRCVASKSARRKQLVEPAAAEYPQFQTPSAKVELRACMCGLMAASARPLCFMQCKAETLNLKLTPNPKRMSADASSVL